MRHIKRLLSHVVTAAVGALALQAGVKSAHGRMLTDADTFSRTTLGNAGAVPHDSPSRLPAPVPAPAPAPDPLASFDPGTLCVPDFALLGASFGLITINDAFVDKAACLMGTPYNAEALGGVASVIADVKQVSAMAAEPTFDLLIEEVEDLATFTNSTASCDDVHAYNRHVAGALGNISDDFGALQNMTLCDSSPAPSPES